jgi:hypothetical protein
MFLLIYTGQSERLLNIDLVILKTLSAAVHTTKQKILKFIT